MLARVGAIMRLRARGRYFVHAAGVVDPAGRAFVLAGDSGAGKSTLAFALARCGWGVLGDDGVVLEARAHGVVAHPWRDPLRVSADVFPELTHAASVSSGRGPVADARRRVHTWAKGAKAAPVAALVFLRRADHARLAPMEPLAALAALVRQSPWVVLGDPVARAHLDALRHAATSVPALDFAHTRRELVVVGDMLSAWRPSGAAWSA
jgi:predicted ATPase